jgi:hypothetical protein
MGSDDGADDGERRSLNNLQCNHKALNVSVCATKLKGSPSPASAGRQAIKPCKKVRKSNNVLHCSVSFSSCLPGSKRGHTKKSPRSASPSKYKVKQFESSPCRNSFGCHLFPCKYSAHPHRYTDTTPTPLLLSHDAPG